MQFGAHLLTIGCLKAATSVLSFAWRRRKVHPIFNRSTWNIYAFFIVLFWRIFLVLVEANTHHILRQGANNNFTRFCLKFFSLPEDCTVLGGNGNTLNTRWRLNLVKKECPAPQSQSIPYRLIPLLTPHSSGWTLPLSHQLRAPFVYICVKSSDVFLVYAWCRHAYSWWAHGSWKRILRIRMRALLCILSIRLKNPCVLLVYRWCFQPPSSPPKYT